MILRQRDFAAFIEKPYRCTIVEYNEYDWVSMFDLVTLPPEKIEEIIKVASVPQLFFFVYQRNPRFKEFFRRNVSYTPMSLIPLVFEPNVGPAVHAPIHFGQADLAWKTQWVTHATPKAVLRTFHLNKKRLGVRDLMLLLWNMSFADREHLKRRFVKPPLISAAVAAVYMTKMKREKWMIARVMECLTG
jgi:hypothetical protein